jgi:hypothetical protein
LLGMGTRLLELEAQAIGPPTEGRHTLA